MFRNLSLTAKLLVTILPLVIVAIGVSSYLNNSVQQEEMLTQAQNSAETYAAIIRESIVAMMISKEQVDDNYLMQLNALRDINHLHIYFTPEDLHLRAKYTADSTLMAHLVERTRSLTHVRSEDREVLRTGRALWQRRDRIYHAAIPFPATEQCQRCHDVRVGTPLGVAEMDISLTNIESSIHNTWVRSVIAVLFFTGIAIIISVMFNWQFVGQRLKRLVDATQIIGAGNLTQSVAEDPALDDIGELRNAVEQMRIKISTAQEQLIRSERLSVVGQMASSIVHDFRTPMSTINLAIESLEHDRKYSPERTREWYRLIHDAIRRMVNMAQELMEFSRKGEFALQKSDFSCQEFTRLVVDGVRSNLQRAGITLNVSADCPGTARFDPDRMHRVLVNIISNAQDALTDGGSIDLTVAKNGGELVFSVHDNGPGIPSEIRDTLFQPFVSAGKKTGSGLGLAIARQIVEQHGGRITVKSPPGDGATFVVTIPVDAPASQATGGALRRSTGTVTR